MINDLGEEMHRSILVVHLVVGLLIALGALGHSLSGLAPVQAALLGAGVAAPTVSLIVAVWHFAGMCMVVLGALAMWNGWQCANARAASWPSMFIGVSYLGYGLAAWGLTGHTFFAVFVVLGAVLAACAFAWVRTAATIAFRPAPYTAR